jgi:hypothetical protein
VIDYNALAENEATRNQKLTGLGKDSERTYDYTSGKAPSELTSQGLYDYGYADAPTDEDAAAGGTDLASQALSFLASFNNTVKAPEKFVSPYSAQIDSMMQHILNNEKFSYNAENDPVYQTMSKYYQSEGKRAQEDTVGVVAARTGGMASSYAASAAAQQGQIYAQKIAEMIPDLEAQAYNKYLQEYQMDVSNLGILSNAEATDYSIYQNELAADQARINQQITAANSVLDQENIVNAANQKQENYLSDQAVDISKFNSEQTLKYDTLNQNQNQYETSRQDTLNKNANDLNFDYMQENNDQINAQNNLNFNYYKEANDQSNEIARIAISAQNADTAAEKAKIAAQGMSDNGKTLLSQINAKVTDPMGSEEYVATVEGIINSAKSSGSIDEDDVFLLAAALGLDLVQEDSTSNKSSTSGIDRG